MPSLRPGESNPGVPALRDSLTLLGYREPAVAPDPELYDAELEGAVQRFQQRHGLDDDGVIGRQTLRQLRVPLSWRVRQIELAMERLRWLPYDVGGRFIVVNIPEFRLRGFDTLGGPAQFTTGVVVGTAAEKTRTPVLLGTMDYLIIRPYWNVPYGITRNELLPSIRRDARYLAKHHYEIVGGGGLLAPDADGLSLLASGGARLRQRPGADNALGLVKFIFPNPSHVYLHDTPAKALFRRSRRDFSHGCIRVENPVGLAAWLLDGGWDDRRIREAMVGDDNRRVNLPSSVQVLLYYSTAGVDEEGQVFFFDDIYGHDEKLAHLLAKE
jgi:murein L,D-transpeptidase YcbB/YkuD